MTKTPSWSRRPATARWAAVLLLGAVLLGAGGPDAGADEQGAASALERARALRDSGDFEGARAAYRQAAEAARAASWVEVEEEARRGVLICAVQARDLLGARDASRDLLAFQVRVGDTEAQARTRADLGYLETQLGRPREGLEQLEKAATAAEAQGDEDLRAASLVRMANARTITGDHVRALGEVEEAVRIYEAPSDPEADPEAVARRQRDLLDALTVLGNLHVDLGDPEQGRAAYDRALKACATCEASVGLTLSVNLGIAWCVEGNYAKALELLVPAAEQLAAAGNAMTAIDALTQIGYVYGALGRHDDALKAYSDAAMLATSDPITAGYARGYAADSLLALGRPSEALEAYQAARKAGETFSDRQLQALGWRGIAEVALARDEAKTALDAARSSLALVEEIVTGLAPVQGALGREQRRAVYETAVRTGFASRQADVAFEMLERSRGALLRHGMGLAPVPGDERPLPDDVVQARERLFAAQVSCNAARQAGQRAAFREAAKALEAAHLDYEAALDRAQRDSRAVGADEAAAPIDPRAVQRALARDEALVLYAVAGGDLGAVVLTRTGRSLVALGRVADVEADVEALRKEEEGEAALAKKAAGLRKRLLDALPASTRGKRLLVSPDGLLGRVPFASLVPDRTVAYLPSATVLPALRSSAVEAGEGTLAVGDPDYSIQHEGRALRVYWKGRRLERLPHFRREIEAIPGSDVTRQLGPQATEEDFVAQLATRPRWRCVHLACHGLVDEDRPAFSSLALTPGTSSDGFLTVQEILGLRIPTDLALLSACETSVGAELAGTGLLGLAQAFLHAGARRVIASLWEVDDRSTSFLMERFYAHLFGTGGAREVDPATALRLAQADTRGHAGWSHPRYWAAWVLWGEPD